MNTFDPKKVTVSFAGNTINGFVDGTFVTVERETDSFTKTVGAGGEVARNKVSNRSGMITFTLMQTADANALLSGILRDAENGDIEGVYNAEVRDNLNGASYVARNAWIKRQPNAEYSTEVGGYEWVIECEELIMNRNNAGGVTLKASATIELDDSNVSGDTTITVG